MIFFFRVGIFVLVRFFFKMGVLKGKMQSAGRRSDVFAWCGAWQQQEQFVALVWSCGKVVLWSDRMSQSLVGSGARDEQVDGFKLICGCCVFPHALCRSFAAPGVHGNLAARKSKGIYSEVQWIVVFLARSENEQRCLCRVDRCSYVPVL